MIDPSHAGVKYAALPAVAVPASFESRRRDELTAYRKQMREDAEAADAVVRNAADA
jgi:hypothetical protein